MPSPTESDSLFRIIVLDDQPTSARLIQLVLESNIPCKVTPFSSTAEFFASALLESADLFLLDILLQESSGIDVCYELRKLPALSQTPVIFFSAHGTPKMRVAALKAGGIDYLDKPFYPEELLARIHGHLKLHQANRRIRTQLEEQQALLRVLCHDLKNPIAGAAALLEQVLPDAPAQLREDLSMIADSCRNALELIEHVASQRSLLNDNCPLPLESLQLIDAINDSLRMLQPAAAAKQIRFVTAVAPELSLVSNRIVLCHNILNNLLTNAIKFSYPGSEVQIRASQIRMDGKTGIELAIEDHGIGMPPALVKSLLAAGEAPGPRAGTSNEIGHGMGLSLVQRYVAKLGGTLHIDSIQAADEPASSPGRTCVRISFPAV